MCNVLKFLRLLPTGDTTKYGSPKYDKHWSFSPLEVDIINRSRRNLSRKRIPWGCYRPSTPNLHIINKTGSAQEPQNIKMCPKLWFWPAEADTMKRFRQNLAGKCRPWVCSSTPNLALIDTRNPAIAEGPRDAGVPVEIW